MTERDRDEQYTPHGRFMGPRIVDSASTAAAKWRSRWFAGEYRDGM